MTTRDALSLLALLATWPSAAGLHAQSPPPEALRRDGACPFECCTYGRWTAFSEIELRAAPSDDSDVVSRLVPEEAFSAETAFVEIAEPGLVVVTDSVSPFVPMTDNFRLEPGDTVYVLDYLGEGYYSVWLDGAVHEAAGFWALAGEEYSRHGDRRIAGTLVREERSRWWVRADAGSERAGWFEMTPSVSVDGHDGCGVRSSDDALDVADVPAWLSMRPNYRVEESTRLAVEAMRACNERFPLDTLRARLDSLRRVHGIEPAQTRSHPEAARQLDVLLERQAARQSCVTSSPEFVRSREIAGEAPDEFRLAVHAEPDSSSARMGTIRIHMFEDVADPRGPEVIELSYRPNGEGAVEVDWLSDRRSIDGYGGYYHTVIERRGDWLRLPADPFPAPAWIDWRAAFHSAPHVEPVFDDVYVMRPVEAEAVGWNGPLSWDAPGVVFLRSDGDRVWFRLEGRADGPCPGPTGEPDASVADAAAEFSLGLSELVDDRGHLDIDVKYAKGC